jgi:hypothetical protein
LIAATLGIDDNLRFCECVQNGRIFSTRPGTLDTLRQGMYATVCSQDRVYALIPSVYRMANYIMGPQSAQAYSGLQDYRATTGENRLALLMSDRSPEMDSKIVASSLEITEQMLHEKLGE